MTYRHRDQGSVVVIALVTLVIGGSAVAGLAGFNIALLRAHVPHEHRATLESEADAVLALTTSLLRRRNLDTSAGCPGSPIDEAPGSASGVAVSVHITCSMSAARTVARTSGLVTTLHSSSVAAQQIPAWAGNIADAIRGPLVINAGTLTNPGVSILMNRRTAPDQQTDSTWIPTTNPWSSYVPAVEDALPGDSTPTDAPDALEGSGVLPPLPPIPLYERPGSRATIGSCTVYFPGRYLGSSSLVLSGGVHYFTSGVYYFERSLSISNGARVVMGNGRHPGCTNDVDAAATSRSPRRHEIEGRGVTLLFGGAGRLFVNNSSLIINARSDDRIAVRTVGFGTSTSTVAIPADLVRLDDGSTIAAASHTRLPPESGTPVAYKTSTLAPSSDVAINIALNGTNPESNRVIVDGQIIVPHGGVHLASTTSSYALALSGGVVTTRLTSALSSAPVNRDTNFVIGFVSAEAPGSVLTIEVTARRDDRSFTVSESLDSSTTTWAAVARSRRHHIVRPG